MWGFFSRSHLHWKSYWPLPPHSFHVIHQMFHGAQRDCPVARVYIFRWTWYIYSETPRGWFSRPTAVQILSCAIYLASFILWFMQQMSQLLICWTKPGQTIEPLTTDILLFRLDLYDRVKTVVTVSQTILSLNLKHLANNMVNSPYSANHSNQ